MRDESKKTDSLIPPASRSAEPFVLEPHEALVKKINLLQDENNALKKENEKQANIISGREETVKMLSQRYKEALAKKDEEIAQLKADIAKLTTSQRSPSSNRPLVSNSASTLFRTPQHQPHPPQTKKTRRPI